MFRRLCILIVLIAVIGALWGQSERPQATQAGSGSDDGRIAYIGRTSGSDTQSDVLVINPDGSGFRNLTGDAAFEDRPQLSPDATSVMFSRYRYTNSEYTIVIKNIDTGAEVTIPELDDTPVQPKWSPSGNQLIWLEVEYTPMRYSIVVMNRDGSNRHEVLHHSGEGAMYDPTFSPDGTQIAYIEDDGSGPHLMVANANGVAPHQVGECPPVAEACLPSAPDWSPDGSQIAVTLYLGSASTIGVVDSAGGEFTSIQPSSFDPAWSPDGSRIIFTRSGLQNGPRLEIMNADGTDAVPLDISHADAAYATWNFRADWAGGAGICQGVPALSLPSALAAAEDDPTDIDGDNIPNQVEEEIGTDPNCQDTDGDGLLDPWEVDPGVQGAGFDLDGDGTPEVKQKDVFGPYDGTCEEGLGARLDLPTPFCALNHPPDPLHKDLYVEIDWQDCLRGDCPELVGAPLDPNHHSPNLLALSDTIGVYRNAPVDNPNDKDGVNLNFLVDEAIPHSPNCDQLDAQARPTNFGSPEQRKHPNVIKAKELVFRYAWSGHSSAEDYTPGSCPLPSFWDLVTSGLGLNPLPYYDSSPMGSAGHPGRDIIITLAVEWICQLYSFDSGTNVPPCFRNNGPGLFPAEIANRDPHEPPQVVPLPKHMLLGLPSSEGVRSLWGRTLMFLLGESLGVPYQSNPNDPDSSTVLFPLSYFDWSALRYAPPATNTPTGVSATGLGDDYPLIYPDLSAAATDLDGDGEPEGSDNCPGITNTGQADLDGDGLGDACDGDLDGDGQANEADAHPADTDNDGADNVTDDDDDGDGVIDTNDNCPVAANADQANVDRDTDGDACDPDADEDGLPNVLETQAGSDPLDAGSVPEFMGNGTSCSDGEDNDGDGSTDVSDSGCVDSDGDTVPNLVDNCPSMKSENVLDLDHDGIGDVCEPTGTERTWGDNNCSGGVDPVDSLLALRFDAGQSTNTGECPDMGAPVQTVGGTFLWGDSDCSGTVDPIDSLKLLRFDSGLNAAQGPNCPPLGQTTSVSASDARRPSWARLAWAMRRK